MGEVFRARDIKLKRDVAIKILPDAFARDPDRVSRFQREAEVLASLNHPNIAAIYELAEANGSRFLVLFTDHYTFSPSWTNEFRFSYGRQNADRPERISPQSVPQASTLPYILIGMPKANTAPGGAVDGPGVRSGFLNFQNTNNLLFQETQ